MKTSLITIVTSENHLLDRQADLIAASAAKPDEWIVVALDAEVSPKSSPIPVQTRRIASRSRQAIAAAYAEGVRQSIGARLVFLDASCLPLSDVFSAFSSAMEDLDALWICHTSEISSRDRSPLDTVDQLLRLHRGHQASHTPRLLIDRTKFRSDCFAISRENYRAIGGFDPAFTGWDTEDVDFGFAAEEASIALGIVDVDAVTLSPDIPDDPKLITGMLQAARAFRSKWGVWPRLAALRSLAIHGYIEFNAARDHLRLLQLPKASELRNIFRGPALGR